VVLNREHAFPGGVNKFPGGRVPLLSATWKILEGETIPSIYILNVRKAWNTEQLLQGCVVEKRVITTGLVCALVESSFVQPVYDFRRKDQNKWLILFNPNASETWASGSVSKTHTF